MLPIELPVNRGFGKTGSGLLAGPGWSSLNFPKPYLRRVQDLGLRPLSLAIRDRLLVDGSFRIWNGGVYAVTS